MSRGTPFTHNHMYKAQYCHSTFLGWTTTIPLLGGTVFLYVSVYASNSTKSRATQLSFFAFYSWKGAECRKQKHHDTRFMQLLSTKPQYPKTTNWESAQSTDNLLFSSCHHNRAEKIVMTAAELHKFSKYLKNSRLHTREPL